MDNILNSIPVPTKEPEDYVDEEGYLVCGKCHTRKEAPTNSPIFKKTDIYGRFIRPGTCKCREEEMERERREHKEREHIETVARMKSICFKSPARKEQTFENATLVQPVQLEKAKAFVKNWDTVKHENSGLLFYGGTGTGKSYTAACIANALMEQEVSVLMRNMGDFLNDSFVDRDELCREIGRYSLVIFDDLGAERGTEYGLEMVFRLIDARCESGKPTIITTNLSLKELTNPSNLAYQRIYERVLEMCTPIYFSGKSVRGQIHHNKKEVIQNILREDKD